MSHVTYNHCNIVYGKNEWDFYLCNNFSNCNESDIRGKKHM